MENRHMIIMHNKLFLFMRLHHMMIWHNIILKTNYDFQSCDYMMTFYHMMTFPHMMIFHHMVIFHQMMNMHHNIKTRCACSSKGLPASEGPGRRVCRSLS